MIAAEFNRKKLMNQFKGAYACAPYFAQTYSLLEQIVHNKENNLFEFIRSSIEVVCDHLDIKTEIQVSSAIAIDHDLKNEEKILALCDAVGACTYINAIGGIGLYSPQKFKSRGIELRFMQTKHREYPQFGNGFVPNLSIVDVMMFNDTQKCTKLLEEYDLV